MRTPHTSFLILGSCILLFLSACGGGPSGVRVTQGDEQVRAPRVGVGTQNASSTVVHVDMNERIATVRNGNTLPAGFLVATNSSDEQTASLKLNPTSSKGLRTADILEGTPGINDLISPASPTEADRLSKIYRDAESQ